MQKLTALTPEQIAERAPQVYTQAPHAQVSDKYTFLPTYQIVEDMEKLGWLVADAKTMKSKNATQKQYGKHIVMFYHPEIFIKDEQGGIEAYPQIMIQNNHRGWGRFKFEIGIFRLVCTNGLVIKSADYGTFEMRHLGYSFEELKELVEKAIDILPNVVEKINTLSSRILSDKEMREFAEKAIQARFGEEKLVDASEINQVLSSTRDADNGTNLWVVMNRVQEHLVRGGFTAVGADKKERKVRKITNMLKDVELNQKLWELTEQFA
jgi:hypothetical protein